MPRIWADSLEQHKADVRSAVMTTAAEMAATEGVRSLTMSRIAQQAGISRATLYTYFSDVDEILRSWHTAMVDQHLAAIEESIEQSDGAPPTRLIVACERHIEVLTTHYNNPLLQPHPGDADTLTTLERLHAAFARLVSAALPSKADRHGLSAADYTSYLLASLDAASRFSSSSARRRLIEHIAHPGKSGS
jgi:AcrR family transcriptional regulator